MKKVVISCGPIPARLDSVKFITNRFKGGLAFKTARELAQDKDIELTIVKWVHTPLPWTTEEMVSIGIHNLVDVVDVVEYAKWFKDHAMDYDAFIMAAAVANLMPSYPYETKFPSHRYKVGDKFDIQFEIAPRAIDVIKKVNPRCCLIGYKLFDAETDKQLIEIARHTLEDAKANVIFANTPKDAKVRKIAVTANGAAIPMTFDEHIRFIKKAIYAEYFRTEYDENQYENDAVTEAMWLVNMFEHTFHWFGTVAIRIPGIGMMTTARGHNGHSVLVTGVDFEKRIVTCAGDMKATLNAPLLWKMLERNQCADYIIHRHLGDPTAVSAGYDRYYTDESDHVDYEFPGTMGEVETYNNRRGGYVIRNHGYMIPCTKSSVDWGDYYKKFPGRYFGTRDNIEKILCYAESHPELESMEVGGNSTCRCKYNLDPNMHGSDVLSYADLDGRKFDIIVARNSINYLSEEELAKVMSSLKDDGMFIANGFANAKEVTKRIYPYGKNKELNKMELAIKQFDQEKNAMMIHHFLILDDDIYEHSFYARGEEDYRRLGFEVERIDSSIIIHKGFLE